MKHKIIFIILILIILIFTNKREGFTDSFRGFVNPKYKYTKEKVNDIFAYFGIY